MVTRMKKRKEAREPAEADQAVNQTPASKVGSLFGFFFSFCFIFLLDVTASALNRLFAHTAETHPAVGSCGGRTAGV